MQCRDVREVAESFLSEELLTETNHEILRHLDTCPACREDIENRRALRESVRAAFDRAEELKASPEFVVRLHKKLREAAREAPRRRALLSRGAWALAAGVLLVIGVAGAFWARDRITGGGAVGPRRVRQLNSHAAFPVLMSIARTAPHDSSSSRFSLPPVKYVPGRYSTDDL